MKLCLDQYNDIRRKMNKSGCGNILLSFPYADEMADLLDSHLSLSIQNSIDSSISRDSVIYESNKGNDNYF